MLNSTCMAFFAFFSLHVKQRGLEEDKKIAAVSCRLAFATQVSKNHPSMGCGYIFLPMSIFVRWSPHIMIIHLHTDEK